MNRERYRDVLQRGWGFLLAGLLALPAPLLESSPALAAATTFTVNVIEDSNDGLCTPLPGGDCTLREAIIATNNNAGRDTIAFNIPGGGVKSIKPTSSLPSLTEAVIIDGYIQPGAKPNTSATGTNAVLLIEIDGGNLDSGSGLNDASGQGSVFRGLVVNNFPNGYGLAVAAAANAAPTVIEGNFLGVDPSGTIAKPNTTGVNITSAGATVQANVRIGGSDPSARNLISGNGYGIAVSANYTIAGNLVGTDRSGASPLGNTEAGIVLANSKGVVERNVIAFNTRGGVSLPQGADSGHRIDRNAIFANGGLGIDLNNDGPTPNDAGDTDLGVNNLQNFPVLASATTSGTSTVITGSLNSLPNRQYVLQFFANPNAADAEGQTFLSEREVVTDTIGEAIFTLTVNQRLEGQAITATATQFTAHLPIDTSELSPPVTVPRPTPPVPGPQAGGGNQSPSGQTDNRSQSEKTDKKKKKGKKGKKGTKGQKRKGRHRLATQTSGTSSAAAKPQDDTRGEGATRTNRKRHAGESRGRHSHHRRNLH